MTVNNDENVSVLTLRLAKVVPLEYKPALHGTICQHKTATKQASDIKVFVLPEVGT